jgi:transcriptional regulator with XRE-family HTH domain
MAKPNAVTTYPALVGGVLAALRRQSVPPVTQQRVADAVGVSVSTWSRIETGETALTVEQLAMAASMLGTSPGAILGAADIKRDEFEEKGIATASQREGLSAVASSLIQLTGASLARSIGFVAPAAIAPSPVRKDTSERLASAKDEAVRPSDGVGKRVSEVGGTLADQAGRLTGEATRAVKQMLDKAKLSKKKGTDTT